MIEVCKILFDLCFYYTLSGFYLYTITRNYPSAWGIPILMVSAVAGVLLRNRRPVSDTAGTRGGEAILPITVVCCALPAVLLVFRPSMWQIIQFLPAWAYLAFTIWDKRIYTNRLGFAKHFGFTGKLLCLMVFGFFVFNRIGGAVTGAIPYFILYLLSGICIMRIIREEGKLTAGRNISAMIVLLLGSIALSFLQMPQLVLSVAGFIYQNIIARLIMGAAIVVGAVFFGIVWVLGKIFNLGGAGDNAAGEINLEWGVQEVLGEGAELALRGLPAWLEVIFTVLLFLAVAFMIFLIMRRLLGGKRQDDKTRFYTEEREKLQTRGRSGKGSFLRPKDPRQAIRWYYRKYLKEGLPGGEQLDPTDTSLRILEKSRARFPGADAGKLRGIYLAARYRYRQEPTKEDAELASQIWRRLS